MSESKIKHRIDSNGFPYIEVGQPTAFPKHVKRCFEKYYDDVNSRMAVKDEDKSFEADNK